MKNFNGFPVQGIDFLRALQTNNNRDWFEQNKPVFKEHLETPAKAFFAAMKEKLVALSDQSMEGKIFRIYRDVRFSKDKTPYNTYIRMSFVGVNKVATACTSNPGFYFSIDPEQVKLGLGCFEFGKESIATYREKVDDEKTGKALDKLINNLIAKNYQVEGPSYKRVPSGYSSDHSRLELLCRKGLSIWSDKISPDQLHDKKLITQCIKEYRAMLPLYNWLKAL